MSKKKKKKGREVPLPNKHTLYSAAVQSVDADIDFFRRVYKKKRGRPFRLLREDFCGTAMLACDWVRRNKKNHAWGVDLDRKTLDWGERQYVPKLGKNAERLHLLCEDVLEVVTPPVDVVAALNFSYCVFQSREQLRDYFAKVHSALRSGGMFFLDLFGGTEAICEAEERREIPASKDFNGNRVPAFTYVWDQASFNPIDHRIVCHIHFEVGPRRKSKRAFTYDWRLWTIPELRELLAEVGFEESVAYLEGWDDDANDTDGIFRQRTRFENQEGWVAYVVGLKA